jgi:uncharacterized protein YybS (DUF2232 family)
MENRFNKTKSLIEAGLLSALIVIIMLLNVYVPVFSAVGTFLLPIPVTLLYIRYNYKVTLLAVIVSALLIGTLYNPLSALSSAVSYGLMGIVLGYCIRRDAKVSITLLYLTVASVISNLVNIIMVMFLFQKTSVLAMIEEYMDIFKQSTDMTKNIYEQLGVSTQQLESVSRLWEVFTPEYVATLIPAMLLLAGFTSALLNYVVTKAILKKMRYEVKDLTPFSEFYLDNRIGAVIIVFVCLGVILTSRNISAGKFITNSSFIVLQSVLLVDGIAVAAFYLKNRFNINKKFLAIIIFFFIFSPLSVTFVYLGIGDMIFDFRKLDPNRLFGRRNK